MSNPSSPSPDPAKPLIVIDGVFFQMFLTGIARLWWSVLNEWRHTEFAKHVLILDRAGTMPPIAGIRRRVIPVHDYNRLDADRVMLQQVCDEEKADLFVSTYYSTPLRTRSMLMILDMIPEVFNYNFAEPMWAQKRQAVEYASSYVAISHNSKKDLLRFYPQIREDAVTVAHCGVWPVFSPAPAQAVAQFRARHGIRRPYFLSVGMRNEYKNTALLFAAFRQFAQRDQCQILCVGGREQIEPELMELLGGAGAVQLVPRLSDEELAIAYSGAAALVYPSRYEGFGLPVLEAFACGCPVITSRVASIPEVAGEAVLYVDPSDVSGLTNALSDVLAEATRTRLIAAGRDRAKIFNWSSMAGKVRQALLATFGDPIPSP